MQAPFRDVFVGRARELGVLDAGLAAAVANRGGVVLLAGGPGIGKTRTSDEFARRARAAGAEVLVGRCYEGEGAPAFWPWVEILRAYAEARDPPTLAAELGSAAVDVAVVYPELHGHLPGLGASPVLAPEHTRFRFFDGVTRALTRAAAIRPIVLLIDDLQGADKPSLLMLQFLARAVRDARVFVVAALRDLALAREHPVAETLGELMREQGVDLVQLGGLTEEEVGDLLAEVAGQPLPAGLAAAVRARTEGNPLYTMEVARMIISKGQWTTATAGCIEIPETVRLAIGQRLRSLPTKCQDLLTLASIFGREFHVEMLVGASDLDLQQVLALLHEAQNGRVLEPVSREGTQWRFTHALFGETLAENLRAEDRRATHRRVAEALASDPRAAEHAAEIAHHWFEAGPFGNPNQAVAWSRDAAKRALDQLAYEEAVKLYRKALRALDWRGDSTAALRADVLLDLGEACTRTGEVDEAKKIFLEVATIGRQLASPELLTRAALGNAPAVTFAERIEPDPAVVAPLEEAISAWAGRDSGLHACAMARLSLALFFGDQKRSASLGDLAVAMARRIGDAATLRYVLARWLATYLIRLDPETRLTTAAELVLLGEQAGDREAVAMGRLWRCIHSLEMGDTRAMQYEQILLARLAAELRQPVWSWYARVTEVTCAMIEGRFEDAERAIQLALEAGQATLPYAANAHSVFALMILRVLQGRGDEFVPQYRAITQGIAAPAALAPLAWAEGELKHPAEVRRLLEAVTADDFAHVARDISALIVMAFLAEACAFVGDERRAARLYDLMAPLESRWVRWVVFSDAVPSMGPVAHYLGLLARTSGWLEKAATHFEDAIDAAEHAGAPPFLARAQYEYAVLLQMRSERKDDGRASRLLVEARATAAAIGMTGLCRRIDALGAPVAVAEVSPPRVFHRDGELWTISYAGKEIRLRDMRGLHYLATLLREPGREFHAADLVRSGRGPSFVPLIDDTSDVASGLGDAGERLDSRARCAYRTRIAALEDEILEAERLNDSGRLQSVRDERELLLAELSAAARGKRVSSDAERARLTATKGIKSALDRIAASHSELGAHLRVAVRRGYFCAYLPDPRQSIEWEF